MARTASLAGSGPSASASSATPAWMAITAMVWAVMSCRSRANRNRSSPARRRAVSSRVRSASMARRSASAR
jgi:hypothetical protein